MNHQLKKLGEGQHEKLADSTKENNTPSCKQQMAVHKTSLAAIENAGGLPAICEAILAGETQAMISTKLGIARSQLAAYLANADSPMYRNALLHSAEGLLDLAAEALEVPAGVELTMAEVQIRRARCDLLKFRASCRNWKFNPKNATEISLAPAAATVAPSFSIVVAINPQPLEKEVIEHDGGGPDMHDPDDDAGI